jgi:hypothetical protein
MATTERIGTTRPAASRVDARANDRVAAGGMDDHGIMELLLFRTAPE